jgi:hypothetical protein
MLGRKTYTQEERAVLTRASVADGVDNTDHVEDTV